MSYRILSCPNQSCYHNGCKQYAYALTGIDPCHIDTWAPIGTAFDVTFAVFIPSIFRYGFLIVTTHMCVIFLYVCFIRLCGETMGLALVGVRVAMAMVSGNDNDDDDSDVHGDGIL